MLLIISNFEKLFYKYSEIFLVRQKSIVILLKKEYVFESQKLHYFKNHRSKVHFIRVTLKIHLPSKFPQMARTFARKYAAHLGKV